MKILTILGVAQIAILLVLTSKIVIFDDETNVVRHEAPNELAGDDFRSKSSRSDLNDTYIYPSQEQLRQIIREELVAALDGGTGAAKSRGVDSPSDSMETAEKSIQWEQVAQRLEYHTSVGSISNTDMQKLQSEIAKLDTAKQKELLGRLTRALNSGQLDGRL